MSIYFIDKEHENGFFSLISLANIKNNDIERISLMYLLSSMDSIRRNIRDLYDFDKGLILPEGLNKGWQTSGTLAICKQAFNLFNFTIGSDVLGNIDFMSIVSPLDKEHFKVLIQSYYIRTNNTDLNLNTTP